MKIKKYKAQNLKEGKQLVFRELGSNAIILSSRTLKTPEGGEQIEIVAAIDEQREFPAKKTPASPYGGRQKQEADDDETSGEFLQAAGKIFREIDKLKDMIGDVSESVRYKYSGAFDPKAGKIFKMLRNADVCEDFALKVTGKIAADNKDKDFKKTLDDARRYLTEHIKIMPPVREPGSRKVMMFIGPTGSGKTTTLVKIAVICKLVLKSNVQIITTDTYKIGGMEQLESLASVAGIPFKPASSPEQLTKYIAEESDRDFILIDTVGRSQQNQEKLNEINNFVKAAGADIIYLVISAAGSEANIVEVIDRFSEMSPNGLIFTKFDEAPTLGHIICALDRKSVPLAYFTDGQQIPEDIEPAKNERLQDSILPKDAKLGDEEKGA